MFGWCSREGDQPRLRFIKRIDQSYEPAALVDSVLRYDRQTLKEDRIEAAGDSEMIISAERSPAHLRECHAKAGPAAPVKSKMSAVHINRNRSFLLGIQSLAPKMIETLRCLDRDGIKVCGFVLVAVAAVIVRTAELDDIDMLFQSLDEGCK